MEVNDFPGVIFDIDGVLVDSNPAHFESWQRAAHEDRFDFPESLFQETFGQTTRAILAEHWHRKLTPEEIAYFDRRKEDLYREIVTENFPAMPGARAFVETLYRAGFPLAVGSSGPRINVDYVLGRLGIKQYLRGIVSGTDVSRGKPAPDIFLRCAEKMGIAPNRCVVIDDSQSGICAAKAAGMKIVGYYSGGHRDEEYADVDLLVRSFEELTPEILQRLFRPKGNGGGGN